MMSSVTRRVARSVLGLAMVVGASFLTGCVSQGAYDNLYEVNRSLSSENLRLKNELDALTGERDRLAQGIGAGEGTLSDCQRQNMALRAQLDKALTDLRDLDGRIANLQFGPLDAATDQALADLASRFPNLIAYDAARGMLRFATDLTFDSGSAVVKSDARPAISALAQILNSPAAQGYEVWIEGHTDSQRISANTAKLHPTNRHLSAHRAIAVIEELGRQSVNQGKMMAAGWGEFRPAVPNSGSGNTPANRRVEIYLAKPRGDSNVVNTVAPAQAAPTNFQPDRATPPTRQIDVTK
jgi:chemotaxis protein MotB